MPKGLIKKMGKLFSFFIVLVANTMLINAQPGSLDTSFGTGGITNTMFPYFPQYTYGKCMALQSDGKIVMAGYGKDSYNYYAVVARYLNDGSLDTAFSQDGMTYKPLYLAVNAVAVQPDNKIVVAGWKALVSGGTNAGFGLARYNQDGSMDSSFSSDGELFSPAIEIDDIASAVTIQTDGKILVAGNADGGSSTGWTNDFALARYNTDGSYDSTFGNNGVIATNFSGSGLNSSHDLALAMAVQQDGKIIVAGTSSNSFAMARYNTEGSLDSTFGSDGKVIINGSANEEVIRSLVIQPDGKIVAGGYADYSFAVKRFNMDGSSDSTFNTGSTGSAHKSYSIAIQEDGKIVAAGYKNNYNNYFALTRYNTNGTLDSIFGPGGTVVSNQLPPYTAASEAYSVAIQADGKIVAGGMGYLAGNYRFALARYNVIAPEILIEGNYLEIMNGDALPVTNDNTDFGTVCSALPKSVTYTIKNKGNDTLSIYPPVSISGTDSSEFSISSIPDTFLTPGDSTSFSVLFTPQGGGAKSTVVTIFSNDPNENPYTFSVKGTGSYVDIDTSVSISGNALKSNEPYSNYQWLDCNNGNTAIPGENGQYFYPSASGNFAVIIFQGTCFDTSYCHEITICSLNAPLISASGSTSFCEGDSITLTAAATAAVTYQWNTGGTTQNITVASSGNYLVTITDYQNCTAISSPMIVSVTPFPNTPVISQNGNTLTSSSTANNQWYRNDSIISGAISQSYTATISGSYSVVVTNTCGSAASAPVNVSISGTKELVNNFLLNIYPNPFTGYCTISYNLQSEADVTLEIQTMQGMTIAYLTKKEKQHPGKHICTLENALAEGIYLIKFSVNDIFVVNKILRL